MTSRMEAEAVIRVRGQGFGQTKRGVKSISDSLQRMQRVAASVALGGGAVEVLRRSIGRAVRLYADVETGLVGIAKTADLSAREVAALDERLKGLSLDATVGLARTELLEIAQAAGQLGVKGVEDLTRFTRTVAQLQGATNLGGAEAAAALARILNVTGESISTVDRVPPHLRGWTTLEAGGTVLRRGSPAPAGMDPTGEEDAGEVRC